MNYEILSAFGGNESLFIVLYGNYDKSVFDKRGV